MNGGHVRALRACLSVLAAAAIAWTGAQPDLTPRALESEELDADTLRRIALRFEIDGLVFPLLEASQVPGLVVSLAYAGEVLAAEAYGSADLPAARPLTLDDPLWLASVTKMLSAMVVHDLAADGVLALDDPIERWLPGVRIPPSPDGASTPITIRHLLTHTAGFDPRLLGTLRPPGAEQPPLAEGIAAGLPPRIHPPGERLTYCNLCYALLGVIIEEATGGDLARAFRQRLWDPLSLASGRITGRDDAAYEAATARPHGRTSRGILALDMPVLSEPTAGAARLSGHDVSRLLAAFTAAEGVATFGRGTREALLSPAFRAHPDLPGWTLGMAEGHVLGHEVVLHGGDLPGAHSLLVVVPSAALAMFVHVNGENDPERIVATADGMRDVRWALVEGIVGLLLGDARERPVAARGPLPGATVAEPGPYRIDRTSRTTAEKLLALTALLQVPLRVEADGSIVLRPPDALSTERRYVPLDSGLYARDHGGDTLMVTADDSGRPLVHLSLGTPLSITLVPPLERLSVVIASLAAFTLLALLVLVSWPAGALVRWRARAPRADDAPRSIVALRWAGRIVALAGLASVALVALLLVQASETMAVSPLLLRAAWLALGLTAAATLVLSAFTVFGAASGGGRRATWIFHALVSVAAAMLLLQAVVWNLTPWS